MNVKEVIQERRAYRSLDKTEIAEDLIQDLTQCAQITSSCFNNQLWRFIFVYDKEMLRELHSTLSRGNE